MSRIVYLMGKSSSGKDTVFKELLKRGRYAVVPYTTRPIRMGEKDGVEYYFTDEEKFQDLQVSGKVIEHREYNTIHGMWRYFTVDDGQFDPQGERDCIMIGTLEGYRSIREFFGEEKVIPVLIELDDGERLQRALDRERQQKTPKYEELCRRFLADSSDFAEEKIRAAGIRKCFLNNDLEKCLAEIEEYLTQKGW